VDRAVSAKKPMNRGVIGFGHLGQHTRETEHLTVERSHAFGISDAYANMIHAHYAMQHFFLPPGLG